MGECIQSCLTEGRVSLGAQSETSQGDPMFAVSHRTEQGPAEGPRSLSAFEVVAAHPLVSIGPSWSVRRAHHRAVSGAVCQSALGAQTHCLCRPEQPSALPRRLGPRARASPWSTCRG